VAAARQRQLLPEIALHWQISRFKLLLAGIPASPVKKPGNS
jgi:hypothetical protein